MLANRATPDTNATGDVLIRLSDAVNPAVAGAKAAALARLLRAGFDVPDGIVIPAPVVQGFDSYTEDIRTALTTALVKLGPGPYAVRSSGISEDLDDASHAGQYQTVLDVQDIDELLPAIQTVAESANSARITQYREVVASQELHSSAIAVLIQPMIKPEAAGAAFSANPLTGNREEVVINAVAGVADRLMDGEVSADEWAVRGAVASRRSSGPEVLAPDDAQRVASLARRVEKAFGVPQDIEWAIVGGELLLLQSRPITALPVKPDLPPPPDGYWTKEDEHFVPPVSPLFFSIHQPNMREATSVAFESFGLLVESVDLNFRAGEVYERLVPLGGKDAPPPPRWVLGILSRLVPSMRRRMRLAEDALRTDLEARILQRWDQEWKHELKATALELRAVDLVGLTDHDFARHLDAVRELTRRGFVIHFQIGVANLFPIYRLVRLCGELFGWDEHQALALLYGSSPGSSVGSRDLDRIAELARQNRHAMSLLMKPSTTIEKLDEVVPSIAAEIRAHLQEYGDRMIQNDPMSPTFFEVPSLTLQLLRDRLTGDGNPREQSINEARRSAEERAESLLATQSMGVRTRFQHALHRARWAYGLREENVYLTLSHPFALIRYAVLEAGRRLSQRGMLDNTSDAFYCLFDELRSAIESQAAPNIAEMARHRRLESLWTSANPGPASFGSDPGAPDTRSLPESAREIHEAILWTTARMRAPKQSQGDGLAGVPASPGRHKGPVRIIRNEHDFHRLQPGDVLVCTSTSSSWAVLFGTAGALVTDRGGSLSHPAIIAREHGIPAVVATQTATRTLKDGEMVIVDGSAGRVEPVEAP